ncbi:MAG: hypothetical protein JOS17DRAFT_756962 [Linnemannia elongata]|nr:MAG: hypothetical protein JOS17DRAFT_756962 [Linnemannia elongata]
MHNGSIIIHYLILSLYVLLCMLCECALLCCDGDPPRFLTHSLCRIAFFRLSPPGYYAHLTFVLIALPFH